MAATRADDRAHGVGRSPARSPSGTSSRRSCAADGGSAARRSPVLRQAAVGGSGTGGGHSGFLPRQNSSLTAEQIVNHSVRPGGAGDLQGFSRGQGSTAFSEQIPEFPVPGGSREDFQPVQGSAASSSDLPGQAGQGVFRTFPQNKKKARHKLRTRVRNCLRTRAHGRRRLMTRP